MAAQACLFPGRPEDPNNLVRGFVDVVEQQTRVSADNLDGAARIVHEYDAAGTLQLGRGHPEMFLFHRMDAVAVVRDFGGEFVATKIVEDATRVSMRPDPRGVAERPACRGCQSA